MKSFGTSIIKKLLIGLVIIFVFGVITTIYLGSNIIEKNNQSIITTRSDANEKK